MTIAVADLFKAKPFPKWFSEHSVFKKIDKVKKVFPGIGLPNCEQEIDIDNVEPAKAAAMQFLKTVEGKVSARIISLIEYIEARPEMSAERKAKGEKCLLLLGSILQIFTDTQESKKDKIPKKEFSSKKKQREIFIQNNNGRLAIKLPINIFINGQERPVFRENESLFRVYNKLNELLREGKFAPMTKLEDLDTFKTFSTDNIPNNKFKIIFSSDGIEGSWDVVTMSMRGVTSCQNWTDGEYKYCTIGSLLDPFVGIIYLTSGSKYNKYGSKMMKRSLVRFVINSKTNKPYLLIDNMYPSCDTKILTQFKKFLKSKIGDMEIHYAPDMDSKLLRDSYIPLTDIRKKIGCISPSGVEDDNVIGGRYESIISYQDVIIKDKNPNKKDKQSELVEINSRKKLTNFISKFSAATNTAIRDSDPEIFPEALKSVIKKLQGKEKNNFNLSYVASDISKVIANNFIKEIDKSGYISSDAYIKKVYMNYFNNKNKVINDVKVKVSRDINRRLALKEKSKLKSEHFIILMKSLFPKIDVELKSELKEIISKKKPSKVLPLP